jgi:hypothetical protein
MKTHEKLLNMLENGGDEDEFNARLWCWLNGWKFNTDVHCFKSTYIGRPNYLQSLDACKAVMDEYLKGWYPEFHHEAGVYSGGLSLIDTSKHVLYWVYLVKFFDNCNAHPSIEGEELPTMQTAWLHAMIQAIAHERGEV